MALPYALGDAVFLSRGREGIVRYVGNVHFADGVWCGIELSGGSVGTNGGEHTGWRYFACPNNRGVFVRIGKVRRRFREKDMSSAHRQKRMSSLWRRLSCKSILEPAVVDEIQRCSTVRSPTIKVNDTVADLYSYKTMNLAQPSMSADREHLAAHSPQSQKKVFLDVDHVSHKSEVDSNSTSADTHSEAAKCEYEADHTLDLGDMGSPFRGSASITPGDVDIDIFRVLQSPDMASLDEEKTDSVSRHRAKHSLSNIEHFKLFETTSPIPELPEQKKTPQSDATTIREAYAAATGYIKRSVTRSPKELIVGRVSPSSCSPSRRSSFCLTPATVFEDSELGAHNTQSIDEQLSSLQYANSGPVHVPVQPLRVIPRRQSIGRIKGIEQYTAKWIVTFQGMAPIPPLLTARATLPSRKRFNRSRRRLSFAKRKKANSATVTAFTFSIYKDGSVCVLPKTAFGWNGAGHVFAHNQRFSIHSADLEASEEYQIISLNEADGTLQIEHFISKHYAKPIMGIGIRA